MKTFPSSFLAGFLLFLALLQPAEGAFAALVEGPVFYGAGSSTKKMSRGEAISQVVSSFDLQKKQRKFLWDCMKHVDDCFFVFSAMSDYDEIQFYPLILYPDVFPAYKHYKAINTASMLGLVHGYLEEDSSPFYPEKPLTRIEALKVILGAADLMEWKEKFELENLMENMGGPEVPLFADVSLKEPRMWWYHRYLNFAADAGIIGAGRETHKEFDLEFRPDEPITEAELADMIVKTTLYSQQTHDDKEALASADSE